MSSVMDQRDSQFIKKIIAEINDLSPYLYFNKKGEDSSFSDNMWTVAGRWALKEAGRTQVNKIYTILIQKFPNATEFDFHRIIQG